jgi:hypothetical protein
MKADKTRIILKIKFGKNIPIEVLEELKKLERLADMGLAVEKATEKGVAWISIDSTGECIYPSEEEIQGLILWHEVIK